MNIERPGSPSATTVAPTSKRRSTSIETKRSRLASERPPKKGVAIKNAFRSGELIAIDLIYSRSRRRQAGRARRCFSGCRGVVLADYPPRGEAAGPSHYRACVAKLAMYAHRGAKQTWRVPMATSEIDPNVWSGRALQVVSPGWRRAVLHRCIRPLIGAFAPGHHGYQRACVLVSGPASIGPFGSPVFACAGVVSINFRSKRACRLRSERRLGVQWSFDFWSAGRRYFWPPAPPQYKRLDLSGLHWSALEGGPDDAQNWRNAEKIVRPSRLD
jgi:hypothetical protein